MTDQETVYRARQLMAGAGRSMRQAAAILGITPSSNLDRMLWRYVGVPSEDLCEFVPKPAGANVLTSIDLPFPAKILWPNGRGHWTVKAREVKKHRQWAYSATLAAKASKAARPSGRVDLNVTIHPKTRHAIDRDNALASLKAYSDGIAQALGIDDKLFNTPSLTFGAPIKGGLVRMEIVEAKEA